MNGLYIKTCKTVYGILNAIKYFCVEMLVPIIISSSLITQMYTYGVMKVLTVCVFFLLSCLLTYMVYRGIVIADEYISKNQALCKLLNNIKDYVYGLVILIGIMLMSIIGIIFVAVALYGIVNTAFYYPMQSIVVLLFLILLRLR
jgi:hypothetical protein